MTGDRGSVTVVAVGLLAFGLLLAVGLVGLGQLASGRVRATTAADAAALAAAPVTFRSFGANGSPAQEAARFAQDNGAELIACTCPLNSSYAERTVVVMVRVDVDVLGFRTVHIHAQSAAEFRPVVLLGS